MQRKKCEDDDLPLLHIGDLIQEILLRLPVVSLLRFKSVCKSWHELIETSLFIDLHTETTFNPSSPSNKFGSFILLATIHRYSRTDVFCKPLREYALFMISSESGSGYRSVSESGSGAWWLSTGSNYILPVEDDDQSADYDDQVFKVDNYYLGGGGQQLVFKLDSLGCPPCYKFPDNFSLPEIVGSCNGVVCLYDRYDYKDVSLSLWNPATRQFRMLPITIDDEGYPDQLLAFGFDVKTKDYKVLLVTCFKPRLYYRPHAPVECRCQVQVYSLSTNSWRLLEGITCLPGFPIFNAIQGQVVYLNGSCFFMAKFLHTRRKPCFPENDRFIISFDFTKEIFTPIRLHDHYRHQELQLSSVGDKIALFTAACYAKDSDNNDTWIKEEDYKLHPGICSQVFNIFVLNEHGSSRSSVNKETWTKLHSFRIDRERPGECILPRGLSNDGEFAILETTYSSGVGKKMKLYNLVTKEVKKNFLSCSKVMSNAHTYRPSLVGFYNMLKGSSL